MDEGFSQTVARDEDGRSDASGPARSLDSAANNSGTHDTPKPEPHQVGVTVDSPDQDGENIGFDVVGVHGLHGRSRGTWEAQSSPVPGETWFANAFYGATSKPGRVVLYGYDSSEGSGRCYTSQGVYQEAEALLDKLISLRTSDIASVRRPIYFVSHDIGGLVVKAVLVLARSKPEKYSDIADSTRAMVFFGYPHAPRTHADLQEETFRLLSLRKDQYRQGHITRLAKSLTDTISEVNGAFIHTRMVTQAMLVNIMSTHEDAAQRVFDTPAACWGNPFELRMTDKKPHLELTTGSWHDINSPLGELPNEDWLAGDLSKNLFRSLGDVVYKNPPIYPSLEIESVADDEELDTLLKTPHSRILHIQCSSDAARVSEMVRNYLDNNRAGRRMLLYFQFNSHDTRFNNMEAMLSAFVAQIAYNQLGTMSSSIATMVREYDANQAHTAEDMFYHWDFLRGDNFVMEGIHVLGCLDECDDSALWFLSQFQRLTEKAKAESAMRIVIVTTKGTARDQLISDALSTFPGDLVARMDYTPPSPPSLQAGLELSMLCQEDARYAANGLQDVVQDLILACADDEKLCRLLVESLKSNHDYPDSVLPLLREFSKTHDPALIFETILGQMPEGRRAWAQKLLSWMLMSFRPLQASEFCRVAELCIREEDKTSKEMGGLKLSAILRCFTGMLVVVDGEVQFSHPAIRTWIDPETELKVESGAVKAWYRGTTARDRHMDIVQTCLEHLRDDTRSTEDWAAQLPYATQYWTSHYKQVSPVDGIMESIFKPQSTLKRWVSAYTPSLDEASHEPLPVAAHFGLVDIITLLLSKPGARDDAGSRGQALVEAARTGELPALRLIFESYPSGLDFDDVYLQKAVRAASSSKNRELFRELVDHIPKPPYPIPPSRNNEKALSVEIPDGRSSGEYSGNRSDEEKQSLPSDADDPFLWLAYVLFRACSVGEDEIVQKLLSLGATPNPPQNLFVRRNTPLHASGIRCQPGPAKLLVAAGASLTATNEFGRTPLHSAAAYGSHEIITLLLDHGAVINATDKSGYTPLDIVGAWGKLAAGEALLQHEAFRGYVRDDWQGSPIVIPAELGYNGLVELLLRHGFDPNLPGGVDGMTALWQAVRTNRVDTCRILLDNKADPDVTPDGATPPLIEAVKAGNLDVVKLLVEHGADIEKKEASEDSWQRTPLNAAACHGETEMVRYLLSKNADPHTTDLEGWTVIWAAARFGYPDVVRLLVEAKADVNCVCSSMDWTPLHAAAEYPDTVRVLLECGGDINAVSEASGTPLDWAIQMGYLDTVKVFLDESEKKPDLTRVSTRDALREAVVKSHTEVVSVVLEAGGDVNALSETNDSLLSLAIRFDNEPLVRKILEFRPDLDVKDTNDDTALHRITYKTPVESVRLVVNAGAKLNTVNWGRSTPLMIALFEDNTDVVKYLLGKPAVTATLNMASFRDRATPLHLACQHGSLETVRLLLDLGSDPNFDCIERYGTPLIASTLRSKNESDEDKQKIIELLLEKGATPTASSGDFGHPIISASLACPVEQVKLLLDNGATADVHDSFERKPVHLACYNSLEVLNALDVPDSDFAATDVIGRVPLHYAALSGQVDLLEEVLARSERVGVGIDVKDKDGWTPLLWAARASPVEAWRPRRGDMHNEVVSFLLAKGADKTVSAHGLFREWNAVEIARYHDEDSIATLVAAEDAPKSSSTQIRRGEHARKTCNCCLVELVGVYFSCTACANDTALCFKCYGSKAVLHPQHDLKEDGFEYDTGDEESNAPESFDDQGQEQQDNLGDFDDEIVDDEDDSVVPEVEGSVAAAGDDATVVSMMATRPAGFLKTRIGAHR